MSQEEFEKKVFDKHGNDVKVMGTFNGMGNPVTIKCYCGKHGWSEKTINAKNIFAKSFTLCKNCAYSNRGSYTKSSDCFRKLKEYCETKGGKLISTKWVKSKSLYRVKCENSEHPVFENSADKLMNSNQWCPYCCGRKGDFENEIRDIVHSKNGELLSEYTNALTHVKVKCKEHNFIWDIYPFNIKKGRWCPVCNMGYGEKVVYDYLTNEKIKFVPQALLDNKLGKDGVPYRFDFGIFDKKDNIDAVIEVDGEYHQRELDTLEKDRIKDNYCKSLGVKMFRLVEYKETDKRFLDYDWYYSYIEQNLKDFIKEYQYER